MGACVGKSSTQTFVVRNINDERVLVQEGKMIVTPTDLIYIDSRNKEKWEWPLRFLRRYGCEGKVFSFEAGRKCSSGEGLYAFVCDEAKELFDLFAKNISQGKHREEQPPPTESPTSTSPPLFPQKRSSGIQNGGAAAVSPMNTDAQPQQMQSGPKTSPVPGTRFEYTSIQFADAEHPPPLPDSQNRVNYSKIDLTKTAEFGRVRSTSELASPPGGMVPRRPTCPGKIESGISSRRRRREHRSPSSSSTSSVADPMPIKLEPCREKEEIPEHRKMSTTSLKNGTAQYLNISVGDVNSPSLTSPTANTSLNYQNIQVGTGDVNTAIPPQQDYQNVMVGMGSVAAVLAVPNTPPSPVDSEGYPVYVPPSTSTPDYHHHQQQKFAPASSSTPAPAAGGQSDYQNITPGPDVVSSLANSSLQTSSNYLNITPGPNVALSYAEEREHPNYQNIDELQVPSMGGMPMGTNASSTLPHLRGAGAETMQTYAILDIPSQAARSNTMAGGLHSWSAHGEGNPSRHDSDENGPESLLSVAESSRDRSLTTHSVRIAVGDEKSNYTQLDFEKISALQALTEGRKQEKELKKEQSFDHDDHKTSHKKKK